MFNIWLLYLLKQQFCLTRGIAAGSTVQATIATFFS
jgi:hypothetical protein